MGQKTLYDKEVFMLFKKNTTYNCDFIYCCTSTIKLFP